MTPQEGPITIGVTGHRPAGLAKAEPALLEHRVREALRFIAQHARGKESRIEVPRLLSPLAEGADRLVARLALEEGFVLHSLLPFSRAVYERDFSTAASKREFDDLIRQAQKVRELDGARVGAGSPEEAYADVGHALVDESDLLIALWDGKEARGRGGTAEVVDHALERDMPVIWIDARPPHRVIVLPHRLGLGDWWGEKDEPGEIG